MKSFVKNDMVAEYAGDLLEEDISLLREAEYSKDASKVGSSQAVKVVTLDILEIFTPSEHIIQILRFTPVQPNRKKIPIRKAENGSIRKVTLVRRTGLGR